MGNLPVVTSQTFPAEVVSSATPVLVKFTGAGCPTCDKMAPVLESLAQEAAPALKVVQIDAHGSIDVSAEYGVMSLPTMLLFKGGRPVGQWVGFVAKEALKKKMEPLLKG